MVGTVRLNWTSAFKERCMSTEMIWSRRRFLTSGVLGVAGAATLPTVVVGSSRGQVGMP